jgi:hypothetical protein
VTGAAKLLAASIAIGWIGLAPASAGSWKYQESRSGNSNLIYSENGKATFLFGCGRAVGLHVKYPGEAKQEGNATIAISTAKARMSFDGKFEAPFDGSGAVNFVQWDLGFSRQDPELYGERWNQIKTQLLDMLDSRKPLTISAGAGSYRLPPVDVKNWRSQFDDCGQ